MDSKVVIPTEKFEELVKFQAMYDALSKRIEFLEKYIRLEIENGHKMIEPEVCGAILGFEVAENANE